MPSAFRYLEAFANEGRSFPNNRDSYVEAPASGDTDSSDNAERASETSDDEARLCNARRLRDVNSPQFSVMVGFVIVANAVIIGLETEYGQEDFIVFEHAFCIFFFVEMCIRICQLGFLAYIRDPWNLFDFALVAVGVFDLYIAPFVSSGEKEDTLSVLRLLRMLRILRVVRLFRISHELMIIMNAFTKACSGVMWIGLLVFILDYVCAVFLTQSIGQNSHLWGDDEERILFYFGHLGSSMRTLFVIMTLSGWEEMEYTIAKVVPEAVVVPLFVFYILIASYTMLSLITGVICEAILDAQNQDEVHKVREIEESREHFTEVLTELLTNFDHDKSGSLSKHDITNAFNHNPTVLTKLQALDIHVDLPEVLRIHDQLCATSGEKWEDDSVPIKNLVEELTSHGGMAKASHVRKLRREVFELHDLMRKDTLDIRKDMQTIGRKLDTLLASERPQDYQPQARAFSR